MKPRKMQPEIRWGAIEKATRKLIGMICYTRSAARAEVRMFKCLGKSCRVGRVRVTEAP